MTRFISRHTLIIGVGLFVLFYISTNDYEWTLGFWHLFWPLLAVVHVLFAIGVARDAAARRDAGSGALFVDPLVWALAVLVGGFALVVIYWLLHYSIFRREI